MENILEKSFTNSQLGIKLNSYIDQKCNVFFKDKEVAQILGYKNTEDAIKRHVSENNKIKKVQHRETRGCTFTFYINEPGFYELNLDYLLRKYFVIGYLIKYYHQLENMVIITCLNLKEKKE